MANTFKNYTAEGVTTQTVVHTGPALTETTIIGMSIANTSAAAVVVSVLLGTTYLVKNAPIPVGSSLIAIGGDQKLVLEAADTLAVIASDTVDTIVSALEIA